MFISNFTTGRRRENLFLKGIAQVNLKRFSTIATTLALVVPLAGAATAEPALSSSGAIQAGTHQQSQPPESEITPEQLQAAYDELKDSDLPRKKTIEDGQPIVIFTLPTGAEFALPDFDAPQPYVSGGRNGLSGFWLEFTPREQDLLISGGGFALGAAICAVPGVGQAACLIIGAIITGAGWAISSYGKCNTRLHVDFSWTGSVKGARCT